MDAAGLVIGLPGLIQTCVHGYRFVCVMIDLDKTAAIMRLRYRIEESRLVLWGRFWGLLDPDNYSKIKPSTHSLDDLLKIPGIETLINDILKQVMKTLEDVRQLSKKYSNDRPSVAADGGPLKAKPSTSAKIKWAIKDKEVFEATLTSLTTLNDGLEQLLPRQQRLVLEQALVGEVLAEEKIKPGDETSKKLNAAFEGKESIANDQQQPVVKQVEAQAQMISHNSIRRNSSHDGDSPLDGKPDGFEDVDGDDDDGDTLNESSPAASMQLPMEWFANTAGKSEGFSMELMKLPPDFEPGITKIQSSSGPLDTKDFVETAVFVEWRNYDDTTVNAQLQMALDVRREEVSRMFRRGHKSDNHHVMQCLGFVLPDKSKMGLVFRPPKNQAGPPISLHEMMRNDFESATAVVPDLEERLQLAKTLSAALYQLQCSGWLHRQISSHNVVFFPILTDSGEISVSLSNPKLVGWQTARFDDQIYAQHSEGMSVWRKNKWQAMELPYVHPSRPAAGIRFKRSFDTYSLGIVLAEIAFWEPIDVLGGDDFVKTLSEVNQASAAPQLQRFSEVVISTCKTELAGEVGGRYKSAVVWALEGVKNWHAQQAAARYDASKEELDKEIGLEKAFFWNVLSQLSDPLGTQA